MNPGKIEVHIEELVLHGFTPASRWHLADEVEAEFRELLLERGIPVTWQNNPPKLEGGTMPATRRTSLGAAGAQIANAIYHSDLPNPVSRSHPEKP
jgi:hypothetical protein